MLKGGQGGSSRPHVPAEAVHAHLQVADEVLEVSRYVAVFAGQGDRENKGLVEWRGGVDLDAPAVAAPGQMPLIVAGAGPHRADHGVAQADDAAVGIEGLGTVFDAVEVEFGGDLLGGDLLGGITGEDGLVGGLVGGDLLGGDLLGGITGEDGLVGGLVGGDLLGGDLAGGVGGLVEDLVQDVGTTAGGALDGVGDVLGGATDPELPMARRMADVWARFPDVKIHLYGNTWRAGRKIGHVNLAGDELPRVRREANLAADYLVNARWADGYTA